MLQTQSTPEDFPLSSPSPPCLGAPWGERSTGGMSGWRDSSVHFFSASRRQGDLQQHVWKKKKKKNQNRDIKTSMTHSTELWGIYIYQLPHFSNRVKQIWLYKHFLQDPNTLSYGNTGTEILSHWAWSSLAVQHFPCPIKEEMNQPLHWLHWKITLNSFCMSFLGHRPPTPPSSHCPFGT